MKKRRLALAGLKSEQYIVEGHISEDEDSDKFSDEEEKKPGMMRRFTIKEKIEILDKYAAMGHPWVRLFVAVIVLLFMSIYVNIAHSLCVSQCWLRICVFAVLSTRCVLANLSRTHTRSFLRCLRLFNIIDNASYW